MAGKLYWRIKKNGKWTWKPAKVGESIAYDVRSKEWHQTITVSALEEE